MKKRLLVSVAAFIILNNSVMADSPFEKYLKKISILTNENGHRIDTYEDVEGIELNPLQEKNKPYPIVSESEIPEGYVNKGTAGNFFKKFSSNALIVDEEVSFSDFINEHMVIKGNENLYYSFPAYVDFITQPGSITFSLDFDDSYRYVSSFKGYSPDALSCNVAPNLCGEKCKVKSVKKNDTGDSGGRRRRNNDIFGDGYNSGYNNDSGVTTTKKFHVNGSNNIYANFRENILAKADIEDANSISIENAVVINAEDRTPPFIKDGYELLGGSLGSIDACTSGDWYKTKDLEVADNNEKNGIIAAKFAFGRLGAAYPQQGDDWQSLEDWSYKENIKNIEVKGQKVKTYKDGTKNVKNGFYDIVKFPYFDGVIRYSVFLKESGGQGNTNPGVEKVLEDSPEEGYGYKVVGDLGRTPLDARPWPDKRDLSNISGKGYNTNYIRVFDNDRPNVAIRVTEVETGKQMFFPPCLPAGHFPVRRSSIYKAVSGLNGSNQDDYDYFVKDLGTEYDYKIIKDNPNGIPYYTIYSINGYEKETTELGGATATKMLKHGDIKFINQNVRLEDYDFSDTDASGNVTYRYKNDEYGKKLGTTASMTILFENSGSFVFKPDVEYQLDVWIDDNVKWTNINPANLEDPFIQHGADGEIIGVNMPEVLEYAKVYATGIKEGVIRVNIPDERENRSQEVDIDVNKGINGGIVFTLKDTTDSKRVFNSLAEIDEMKFPSIEVFVKDFAGYTRFLKMYFRVGDRNLNIRTLD